MKNLNQESRSKSVRTGTFLWMYSSKLAAKERRKIRYHRDAELKPNEATKAAIERQILQIDKDILSVKILPNNYFTPCYLGGVRSKKRVKRAGSSPVVSPAMPSPVCSDNRDFSQVPGLVQEDWTIQN